MNISNNWTPTRQEEMERLQAYVRQTKLIDVDASGSRIKPKASTTTNGHVNDNQT
jgi:hypothetical protein